MNSLRFCLAIDFCLWKFTLSPQDVKNWCATYFAPPQSQSEKYQKICKPEGHEGRVEVLAARPAYLLTLLKGFDSDISHQASIRRECAVVCCSDFSSFCSAFTQYFIRAIPGPSNAPEICVQFGFVSDINTKKDKHRYQ